MRSPLHLGVEAQPHAATLYLRGALSFAGTLRVARAIGALPDGTRALRIDLRALHVCDHGALRVVLAVAEAWTRRRRGMVHVTTAGWPDAVPPAGGVTVSLQFRAGAETEPTESSPVRDRGARIRASSRRESMALAEGPSLSTRPP